MLFSIYLAIAVPAFVFFAVFGFAEWIDGDMPEARNYFLVAVLCGVFPVTIALGVVGAVGLVLYQAPLAVVEIWKNRGLVT